MLSRPFPGRAKSSTASSTACPTRRSARSSAQTSPDCIISSKRPTPQGHGLSGALQVTMHPRTTRLAYEVQPQYAYVLGRVEVSIACPATRMVRAGKALALAQAQMQTPVAHLGG